MLFEQLITFRCVAKTGSMTKAAEELNLSQSAVTHQVSKLEERLKVKLLERHGRGVKLTEAGIAALKHVEAILARVEDLESHMSHFSGKVKPRISIAAHRGIIWYILPKTVKDFVRAWPDATVVLKSSIKDKEIISKVKSGEVDFGIITSWVDKEGLIGFELFREEMFVCTSMEHKFAKEKYGEEEIKIEDIAKEKLILYEPDSAIRKRVDVVFKDKGLHPCIILETGGAEILKKYTRIGLGVCILSGLALREDSHGLYTIKVSKYFGKLGYIAVFRKERFFSPALVDFIGLLDPGLVLSPDIYL